MTRTESREWLIQDFADWLRVRDLESIYHWAQANIHLSEELSPINPGPYDPEISPMATILFEWFLDPEYEEFIGVKSSQAGFTQACLIIICYIVEKRLGNIIFCMDSAENAKALNIERLKPMIKESCQSIRGSIPEDEDKLKNMVLLLDGVKVFLAGARSAGKLASRTIPHVFGDEVDEWPEELEGGESNALDLLRDRCKLLAGTGRKKLAVFSKPKNALAPGVEDEKLKKKKRRHEGIIWQEAMTGTRHRCFVPCPHCQTMHYRVWEQVRFGHCKTEQGDGWDYEKMLKETYYECPSCKQAILEHHKRDMLKRREFRRTNFGQDDDKPVPNKMSVLTDDLLSVFPGSTLGHLAVEFTSARTTSARRRFRRSRLGLPVEEKVVAKIKVTSLLKFQGNFKRGTLPFVPAVIFMDVDIQGHGKLFKWIKTAFDYEGNAYIFDHGLTEDENEIGVILALPIEVMDWGDTPEHLRKPLRAVGGWVDEGDGFTTADVLDLCISRGIYPRFAPAKGRGGKQTANMQDRVTKQKSLTHRGRPLTRYLMDSDYFLDEIYEDRFGQWSEYYTQLHDGKKPDKPNVPRVVFYEKPDTDFLSEFTTEKKDWHIRGGRLEFGWLEKPEGGPNDYSDGFKMALAKWYRWGPKLIKAHHEQKLQAAKRQYDLVIRES